MSNGQRDELKRLAEMFIKDLDENQNRKPWTNARFMGAEHQLSSLVVNVCKDFPDQKPTAEEATA